MPEKLSLELRPAAGRLRLDAAARAARMPELPPETRTGLPGDRRLAAPGSHADGRFTASDGKAIPYRTTAADRPRAILVFQQGTMGEASYFDAMGERLAQAGIASYAVGSRTSAPRSTQHADDLDRLVAIARREHPGVPVTVGGVSLGASIALDWRARHGGATPVAALSPVVLSKFQGPEDLAKVMGGLAIPAIGRMPVGTPMSAGRPLTTNPASPEAHLADPQGMKVPAALFGDVLKMNLRAAALRGADGPLLVGLGGADAVNVNPVADGFAHLLRSSDRTIRTFPGAAHDLSQETNHPAVVASLRDFVLQAAEG